MKIVLLLFSIALLCSCEESHKEKRYHYINEIALYKALNSIPETYKASYSDSICKYTNLLNNCK